MDLASSKGLDPHSYALTFSWSNFWGIKINDKKKITDDKKKEKRKKKKIIAYSENISFIEFKVLG